MLIINPHFGLQLGLNSMGLLHEFLWGRKVKTQPEMAVPTSLQNWEKGVCFGFWIFYFWGRGMSEGIAVVFKQRRRFISSYIWKNKYESRDFQTISIAHISLCVGLRFFQVSVIGSSSPQVGPGAGDACSHSGTTGRRQRRFLKGVGWYCKEERGDMLGRDTCKGLLSPQFTNRESEA